MNPTIGFAKGLKVHPEEIKSSPLTYVWLEAPSAVCLAWAAEVSDWHDLKRWPSGRCFGEAGEYRWQLGAENALHAVLLLENADLFEVFQESIALKPVGEDADYVLWGDWVDPERDAQSNPDGSMWFYAPEIPEIQSYPIPQQEPRNLTPCLVVRRYLARDEKHGEFLRCVNLSLKSMKKEA